ncbi:hypothetical protein L6164_016561 [Bauhinia variegata]|uniref:Uncharacterized protein n=1 Tax=Bauhinia variegata TaxID=167791 RepID=A0ACB9NP23_BAUVA|nr:hypothetical protein L6164_016561 [Bauhinia variegata]
MSHQNTHGLPETNTIHDCSKPRFNSGTDTTTSMELSNSIPSLFLPEDCIIEILFRIPAKSLLRFIRVSKSWKSLILDPQFVKKQLHRDHQLVPSSPLSQWISGSVKSLLDNPSDPVLDSGLTFEPTHWFEILASCNDLLCCVGVMASSLCFYLYNPSTGWKSRTANFFYPAGRTVFGFGYDDLTHKYKLVSLCLDDPFYFSYGIEVKVCTFVDHDSLRWFRSFSAPTFSLSGDRTSVIGTFLRGTLNWLVEDSVSEFILSFDLRKETFGKVLLPVDKDKNNPCIGVFEDCLYFSADNVGETDFIVWLMKDYGVEDSWTKVYTISYLDYDIKNRLNDEGRIQVISLSEDGDQMLFQIRDCQFALHNSKDNTLKYFEIEGFHGLAISYAESLVQPFDCN